MRSLDADHYRLMGCMRCLPTDGIRLSILFFSISYHLNPPDTQQLSLSSLSLFLSSPFLPFPSTFFLPFPPCLNTCSYPSSCPVAIPWSLVVYMIPGVVTGAQIAAALQGRFTKGETAVMTSSACVFSCLWKKV